MDILKTRTIKDSSISFLTTFINGALGLFFYSFVGNILGPVSYGIFSFTTESLNLIKDLASLGTNTGIIRFVGKFITKDKTKAYQYLKLGFITQIVSIVFLSLVGWFGSPYIVNNFLNKPELLVPLRIAFMGFGIALIFTYSSYVLQAMQRFLSWGIFNISSNLLRLLLMYLVFYFGLASVYNTLWVYILPMAIFFVISIFMMPNFWSVKNPSVVAPSFFKYNSWVFLFTLTAAINARVGIYLTTKYLSFTEVGLFAAASQLASIVPHVVFALAAVVAPKLSSFDLKQKALSYFWKIQLFVLALALIGILVGVPFAKYVFIPYFFGSQYLSSVQPFTILLISQAVFLISLPVHTYLIYYFGKPNQIFTSSVFHLIINFTFGMIMIQSLGILGASLAVLIGNVVNFIIPAVYVAVNFRRLK